MVDIVQDNLPLQAARAAGVQSIDLLLEHGLAPTPMNYAVVFEYLHGTKQDLRGFLDNHLKAGKPLDEILLQDLYERHIAAQRLEEFQGMRNDLQSLLQALMQTMSEASRNNTEYRAELEANIDKLGRDPDQTTLKGIAMDMLAAAVTANEHASKLQEHLAAAQQETEQLRAELEAQRQAAMVDPLTGLLNRRAMDHHLEMLWEEDRDLSVLVMDIDHFKRINDTYGHAVGDIVLRNVAEAVRKCIRGEDIAIRFGGEEFLVILPNTCLDGAVTVAESIRKRIAALRLVRKHDNFALAPFTISLGVANRRGDDDPDSLFERADKALYHAKSNGRNRVVHENHLH